MFFSVLIQRYTRKKSFRFLAVRACFGLIPLIVKASLFSSRQTLRFQMNVVGMIAVVENERDMSERASTLFGDYIRLKRPLNQKSNFEN